MTARFACMTHSIRRFARDERAATSIEYALLATGVAGACLLIWTTLGQTIQNVYYAKLDPMVR